MSDDTRITIADGRSVPTFAVAALEDLERRWPGAVYPGAMPAVVLAVLDSLKESGYTITRPATAEEEAGNIW
ncbi:hypothetical protein [Mycobacteroides franklinii]|uniref:hypothetical protein n=1 Tax=Mycobacteroides franklinii TaxID=948102 RepID=UPI0012FF5E96|nr:hypothetical protein [Mycobacteroides franklinii]